MNNATLWFWKNLSFALKFDNDQSNIVLHSNIYSSRLTYHWVFFNMVSYNSKNIDRHFNRKNVDLNYNFILS